MENGKWKGETETEVDVDVDEWDLGCERARSYPGGRRREKMMVLVRGANNIHNLSLILALIYFPPRGKMERAKVVAFRKGKCRVGESPTLGRGGEREKEIVPGEGINIFEISSERSVADSTATRYSNRYIYKEYP